MSVRINIPSYLQPYTDENEVIEVNGNTVGECLGHLIIQFPDIIKLVFQKDGRLLDYVSIYNDGDFRYADESAQSVKDGDELHLLYILGGG